MFPYVGTVFYDPNCTSRQGPSTFYYQPSQTLSSSCSTVYYQPYVNQSVIQIQRQRQVPQTSSSK
jgi:hypothetical protein